MGKRNKERIQRIIAGNEKSIRAQVDKIAPAVTRFLNRGSTQDKIGRLDELSNKSVKSRNEIKQTLMANAPAEMDKGIRRLIKEGKEPTVELLLDEYDKEKSFQEMCNKVGLDREWFVNLAKERL